MRTIPDLLEASLFERRNISFQTSSNFNSWGRKGERRDDMVSSQEQQSSYRNTIKNASNILTNNSIMHLHCSSFMFHIAAVVHLPYLQLYPQWPRQQIIIATHISPQTFCSSSSQFSIVLLLQSCHRTKTPFHHGSFWWSIFNKIFPRWGMIFILWSYSYKRWLLVLYRLIRGIFPCKKKTKTWPLPSCIVQMA